MPLKASEPAQNTETPNKNINYHEHQASERFTLKTPSGGIRFL